MGLAELGLSLPATNRRRSLGSSPRSSVSVQFPQRPGGRQERHRRAGAGVAGPKPADRHGRDPCGAGQRSEGAADDAPAADPVRLRLLLGGRKGLLAPARGGEHGCGVCGRQHPQSHLRRGVLRPDRPHRGGAGGLGSTPRQPERSAEAVLGMP